MNVRPARREALGALVAGSVLAVIDCAKRDRGSNEPSGDTAVPSASSSAPRRFEPDGGRVLIPGDAGDPRRFGEQSLEFASSPVGPEKALAIVPQWGVAGERFPVLVALHGRGEAVGGLDVGSGGWLRAYGLARTIARLRSPPLTRADFKGFVDDARLARINASLAERPFRGVIVACPWVPDLVNERDRTNLDAALPFGRFVVEQLLPRVVAETPALAERATTGIDGVSLGGRVALVVGLAHADRFGAVGTLQAAIQENETPALVRRVREAAANARGLYLRLVTSHEDYFRTTIVALHLALQADHLAHEHLVIPGPHDYAFNRGPGGIEMLLWHDRVLRGEPPL